MSKIFIINHYAPNRGDSAVLESMLDIFSMKTSNVEFIISSAYPHFCIKREGLKLVEWLINIEDRTIGAFCRIPVGIIQDILWAVLIRNGIDLTSHYGKKKQMILKEYIDSDIIISPGGHHLTDINGFASFFVQWYQMFIAVIIGKPLVIYAQTIGPFVKFSQVTKFMTRFVLNRSSLITVRENISKERLSELSIKSPIYLTADSVFLLKPSDYQRIDNIFIKENILRDNSLLVGITVYHSKYHGFLDPGKKHYEYKKITAKLADYLVEKYNARIVFIPMEMRYHGDDTPLIQEITELMRYKTSSKIVSNEYSAKDTLAIIGKMDLVIAAKTHSIIFALTSHVPTICIAYDSKSREFMKMCNLEKFAFEIGNLDFEVIKERIDEAIINKDRIRNILIRRVRLIENSSTLNCDLTLALLNTIHTSSVKA